MSARGPYSRRSQLMAREQLNDEVADIFARIHKDQKVFYVGSVSGNSAFGGRRVSSQKATINQALSSCVASRGDVVLVSPFHAETVTAPISLSKIGVTVKGLQVGNQRPVISVNGAVDLFSLDAAGCRVTNLDVRIVTTDAATAFFNIAAAKCMVDNCRGIGSDTSINVVDCFTLTAAANDAVVKNNVIWNTTVPVNSFLSLEGAAARVDIIGNHFSGDCATAGIIDAATVTFLRFMDNLVKTVGTNIPACVLDSNPTGEAKHNHMYGTDATIANNINWGSALLLGENFVRGGTGSTVSATSISPALDT